MAAVRNTPKSTSKNTPKIIAEKTDDFKQIFVDGAYTWLGDDTGTITFFADTFVPELDEHANLQIKTIKRNFPVEIRMSHNTYVNLINWMIDRKKLFDESKTNQK